MVEKNGLSGNEPVVRRVKPADTDTEQAGTEKPALQKHAAKLKSPPRKKITPEEVEAKFAAARAEREARRANSGPRDMGKLVRVVIASALGVGIVGFSLGINNASAQHTVVVETNTNKEAALTGALEELPPAAGGDTAQELADSLAVAQQRSDQLAAAQQQFAGIAYAGNDDPATNDGRPKPSVPASLEHRRTIAGFFSPESLVLTDAEAYTFRTEDLLGPGRIDPRQPWFTKYEPVAETDTANGADSGTESSTVRKVMDPASYIWKTASVTLSGTPDVMDVLWTNTDTKTGELLAWATARYSAESNTFRNLSVSTTTRGDSFQLKVGTAGSASDSQSDTTTGGTA
jgi:hypothetical protein